MTPTTSWVLKLLGPMLLIGLLATTDREALVESLRRTNALGFATALGLWLIIAGLKAWRWRLICGAQNIHFSARLTWRWYAAGLFLGGVSPGRVGELVKVTYIRGLGHSTGKALFSTVMDRIWDILVMPAMALVALVSVGVGIAGSVQLVALIIGPILAIWLLLGPLRTLLLIPLKRLVPASYRQKAAMTLEDFMAEFGSVTFGQSLWAGSLTTLCWLLYVAAAQALCVGLGVDIPIETTAAAVLGAALAGLLPITVSGVGTRDAVFIFFFQRLDFGPHDAIALATLMLGLNLVVLVMYWPFYQRASKQT